MNWMSDDLIAYTRRVWSPHYGYDLSEEDAVEILSNVKQFAEVLSEAAKEGNRHEHRDMGACLVA